MEPTEILTNMTAEMTIDGQTEAVPDGKTNSASNGNGEADDFQPSRDALHTEPGLCRKLLERVTASVPLAIRSSNISMGSGLFVGVDVDAGEEIYRVRPMMEAVDPDHESFCHYCLKDTQDALSKPDQDDNSPSQTKLCAACKVARFCSKGCQKLAWTLFHKDECKILKTMREMSAQNLMAHRLIFWQQRGYITTLQGKSLGYLETHFKDYNDDPDRATELLDIAIAVRDATGGKVKLNVPWKIVPLMRINSVRLRPASRKECIGYTFDVVTVMMNHSCDPNAHVLSEGRQLRVRSLRKIAAGEEVTICYVDPVLDVSSRKALLKRNWFFDCCCTRCKSELREQRALLGDIADFTAFHSAQREILSLIRRAIQASNYPGIYPDYEDLPTLETKLRTIMADGFPSSSDPSKWPEHMEPLPSARLSLAMIAFKQGKTVHALRNALKGKFLSTRNDPETGGPEWVNEMVDVVTVLMVAGSLPPDAPAFENKAFPSVDEIRTVTYGYLWVMGRAALRWFGSDVEYGRGIGQLMTAVLAKKKGGAVVWSEEFYEKEFKPAQRKVLGWAGVPEEKGLGERCWVDPPEGDRFAGASKCTVRTDEEIEKALRGLA